MHKRRVFIFFRLRRQFNSKSPMFWLTLCCCSNCGGSAPGVVNPEPEERGPHATDGRSYDDQDITCCPGICPRFLKIALNNKPRILYYFDQSQATLFRSIRCLQISSQPSQFRQQILLFCVYSRCRNDYYYIYIGRSFWINPQLCDHWFVILASVVWKGRKPFLNPIIAQTFCFMTHLPTITPV